MPLVVVNKDRAENEAEKAIWFAQRHGAWPMDLSMHAGAVLAQRSDSAELEHKWGALADATHE